MTESANVFEKILQHPIRDPDPCDSSQTQALRQVSDSDLVHLISAGGADARAAAAEFLVRHRALIRRRLRHKIGSSSRRLFDSEDLFSTVARRIDQEIEKKRFAFLDERQLWGLINRIGDNCITDLAREEKTRRIAREGVLRTLFIRRQREAEHAAPKYQDEEPGDLMSRAQRTLGTGADCQLLLLWLVGSPFAAIAAALGLTEASARKRWQRVRRDLHIQLKAPEPFSSQSDADHVEESRRTG